MRVFKPTWTTTDGRHADRYREPRPMAKAINAGIIEAVNGHLFDGAKAVHTRDGVTAAAWSISAAQLNDAQIVHRCEASRWHVGFTDHLEIRHSLAATTDKTASRC